MNTINRVWLQKVLSTFTISIGLVLLIYMISVESEAGALPLLLIASGMIWYFITKAQNRSV